MEREFIELRPGSYTGKDRLWAAWSQNRHGDRSIGKTGPTPLIAAMRCYCASKLGDEVEVPDELCGSGMQWSEGTTQVTTLTGHKDGTRTTETRPLDTCGGA